MVLRKPYAFLIKHFRIIHAILLVLFVLICYRSSVLYGFLDEYIHDSRIVSGFEDLATKYIGFFMYFGIVLILLIALTIIVLLTQKKKPRLVYYVIVVYYFVFAILLGFTGSILDTIRFESVEIRTMEALKDTFFVFYLIQYAFIVIALVRAIGFNIKQFDFKKDLLELELTEKDNEEFEVNIGLDSEDIFAKIRYFFRKFRYVYKENKILFYFFGGTVVLVCGVLFLMHQASKETIYKEGDTFTTSFYEVSVLNSYQVTTDYHGDAITDGNFYLVLQVRFKNITNTERTLNIENTKVYFGNDVSYTPDRMHYSAFVDFGRPYYGAKFAPQETKEFILVYTAPNEYKNKKFRFGYLVGANVEQNVSEYIYTKVALSPKKFPQDKTVTATSSLGNKLTFKDSILGNTSVIIDSVDFASSYAYKYHTCVKKVCSDTTNYLHTTGNFGYQTTLMRVQFELDVDEKYQDYDLSSFISKFSSVSYVIDGNEYLSERTVFKDVTPTYIPGYAYFEIVDRVERAEQVYLNFTIRGKKYRYLVFDNTEKEPTPESAS